MGCGASTSNSSSLTSRNNDIPNTIPEPPELEFKVVIVGDRATGKTALFERLIHHAFLKEYSETHQANIGVKRMWFSSGERAVVQIYDLAGEILNSTHEVYLRKADAVIITFDLERSKSLDNVAKVWVPEIRKCCYGHRFQGYYSKWKNLQKHFKKLKATADAMSFAKATGVEEKKEVEIPVDPRLALPIPALLFGTKSDYFHKDKVENLFEEEMEQERRKRRLREQAKRKLSFRDDVVGGEKDNNDAIGSSSSSSSSSAVQESDEQSDSNSQMDDIDEEKHTRAVEKKQMDVVAKKYEFMDSYETSSKLDINIYVPLRRMVLSLCHFHNQWENHEEFDDESSGLAGFVSSLQAKKPKHRFVPSGFKQDETMSFLDSKSSSEGDSSSSSSNARPEYIGRGTGGGLLRKAAMQVKSQNANQPVFINMGGGASDAQTKLSDAERKAIITIQALYRGHQARQEVQAMRDAQEPEFNLDDLDSFLLDNNATAAISSSTFDNDISGSDDLFSGLDDIKFPEQQDEMLMGGESPRRTPDQDQQEEQEQQENQEVDQPPAVDQPPPPLPAVPKMPDLPPTLPTQPEEPEEPEEPENDDETEQEEPEETTTSSSSSSSSTSSFDPKDVPKKDPDALVEYLDIILANEQHPLKAKQQKKYVQVAVKLLNEHFKKKQKKLSKKQQKAHPWYKAMKKGQKFLKK